MDLSAVCSLSRAGSKNKEYTHRLYKYAQTHRFTHTIPISRLVAPIGCTKHELSFPRCTGKAVFCKFLTDSSASPFKDCELLESRRDQGKRDDLDVSSAPSYFLTTSSCTASMDARSRVPHTRAGGLPAANWHVVAELAGDLAPFRSGTHVSDFDSSGDDELPPQPGLLAVTCEPWESTSTPVGSTCHS